MTDQPMAADDLCEHYYETRILGGHPIAVRVCIFCRTPDWTDLREQVAELHRWGWQEGRDGKAARETLSSYDKPREATDQTPACIHPDGYDGECPCPTSCSCCPVAAATQTPVSAPDGPEEPRTGPVRQPDTRDTAQAATDQLRADANGWRLKAIRRALTASRLRGTIDACLDLVDEPVTDRTAWGDGYRAGIADLREILREFGHLEAGGVAAPEPAPVAAEPTETATCCVCGGSPVTYRNFREQPFCRPCADCQCGENPCVRTGINDPAVSEGPACTEVANCDGQCCKRAEPDPLRKQISARDAALAACTAQLVHDQAVLARLRSRVQAAADEARGSMRGWLVDALADLDDPRTPAPDGGPTVAECAADDLVWPLQKAGE